MSAPRAVVKSKLDLSRLADALAAALGPEMAAFKQLDTLVHDLSLEIVAAALSPEPAP
jgi:hypothetical protein